MILLILSAIFGGLTSGIAFGVLWAPIGGSVCAGIAAGVLYWRAADAETTDVKETVYG